MTVAAQTVIRHPLHLSLTSRYLSGFDNNWHFVTSSEGSLALISPIHTWLFNQPFLLSLHASLFPQTHHRSGLVGTPKNPNRKACFHHYCSYVAFTTHSTHRVGGWRSFDRQCTSHTTVRTGLVYSGSLGISTIALYTNGTFVFI